MVRASIAAAVGRRANNSLAGVLGSSGWASGGSGFGLSEPLSCARAAPVAAMATTHDRSAIRQPNCCRRAAPALIVIAMAHPIARSPLTPDGATRALAEKCVIAVATARSGPSTSARSRNFATSRVRICGGLAPRAGARGGLKAVQARRVVDQNLAARRRGRHPLHELVEQQPVVDRERR